MTQAKVEEYLGDGVYAVYDGQMICLDLRGQDDTTRICLEAEVMISLTQFQKTCHQRLSEVMVQMDHDLKMVEKLEKLKVIMMALDRWLTGAQAALAHHTLEKQEEKFTNPKPTHNYAWGGPDPYYLSDGGFTHLYSDVKTGQLKLGDKAPAVTRGNWETCLDLRKQAETIMQTIIRSEYKLFGGECPPLELSTGLDA